MAIEPIDYTIELHVAVQRDEEDFIWFHPRATPVPGAPGEPPRVLMTIQKHLQASDYYSGLHAMWSDDLGRSWTGPDPIPELDWWEEPGNTRGSVADVTPGWLPHGGRVLAVGIRVRYSERGEQLQDAPYERATAYAFHDPVERSWTTWQTLPVPKNDPTFHLNGSGCAQWIARPDGSVLIPVCHCRLGEADRSVSVMQFGVDGHELVYIDRGEALHLDAPRGLVEPSLIECGGRTFLTLRNDERGYVTSSSDGLRFDPIRPWLFDDGSELGSYNTQQHWLRHGNALFLTYTRRGADNDHVTRHRAPIFIAQVDPDRLCAMRETERILLPEHGVPMGNFGATSITADEAFVTASEFMWPAWNEMARKKGAAGRTFVAQIKWKDA